MKQDRKFSNLTETQKKTIIKKLNETPNTLEFLKTLNIYFDLEHNQPGSLTKNLISTQVVKIVLPMLNPNANFDI
jgi:hypothetical protein